MSLGSHSSITSLPSPTAGPSVFKLLFLLSFIASVPERRSSVDVCSSSLLVLDTDYCMVACALTMHAQAPLHPLIQHDWVLSLLFVEFQDAYSFGHLPLPSLFPVLDFFPYWNSPATSTPHLEIQVQLFWRDPDPWFRPFWACISPGQHSPLASDVAIEINMLPTMATHIVLWFYLYVPRKWKLVKS